MSEARFIDIVVSRATLKVPSCAQAGSGKSADDQARQFRQQALAGSRVGPGERVYIGLGVAENDRIAESPARQRSTRPGGSRWRAPRCR
jgi:hypothetical protein